ncbi:hypothetical protein V4F39_23255 [Aquincola sp. MAHUQ-54]|uniref:N-acetyltransferase domain-containing protein n=1 Tax=Aquincola agrisoli TaxID=3119538 RepID=A0AAW9QHV4_9BURK
MAGILSAFRAMWKERGWAVTLMYVAHRILQGVSRGHGGVFPYVLVAQPIGRGSYAQVRDDARTVVRVVDADDPVTASFPRPAAINRQRWAAGATCYAAESGGELAGTIWIQRTRYLEDEVCCEYRLADPAVSAWDFDVYVVPRLRLGRTMGRLWKAVDADLAARGVQWSFSRISLFNAASISSHARLGAVSVGRVVFVRIGRAQVAFLGRWPGVHASLGRRPPVIVLAPPAPAR